MRNPPGAPGAEGQPEGGPEGEGAASDGEAGQCRCVVPAHTRGKKDIVNVQSSSAGSDQGCRPPQARGLTVC